MFGPDEIFSRLHQRPFTPFRLVTSSGEGFEILHPDVTAMEDLQAPAPPGNGDQE
jgi:hypothetical protein